MSSDRLLVAWFVSSCTKYIGLWCRVLLWHWTKWWWVKTKKVQFLGIFIEDKHHMLVLNPSLIQNTLVVHLFSENKQQWRFTNWWLQILFYKSQINVNNYQSSSSSSLSSSSSSSSSSSQPTCGMMQGARHFGIGLLHFPSAKQVASIYNR